jgi:pilus assembly protein Flp/PilA
MFTKNACSGARKPFYVVNFLADERGATAIEYALMTSLLAVAIVGALTALGTKISSEFGEISGYLQ